MKRSLMTIPLCKRDNPTVPLRRRRGQVSMSVVAAVFTVWTCAVPALFAVDIVDDPTQIDERVTQLIQTTNSLCWEMNRFHQQQPEYAESYRVAKEIWEQAGRLQESLRTGNVETEVLIGQVTEINGEFAQVETNVSQWGDGDRASLLTNGGPVQRTVVRPGVGVDLPIVGIRLGAPDVVVTEDGPPQIERKRLHPNSHGSKRSLQRELAAVRIALNYLMEDAGVVGQPNSQTNGAPYDASVPQPPKPDPTLRNSPQVVPPRAKKVEAGPNPK